MALQEQTVESFLEAVAARTPSPGGGAVASVVGSLGASLGRMSLAYSINRRSTDDQRRDLQGAIDHLTAIGRQMLDLAEQDAQAFTALDALFRLAEDDPKRVCDWERAVQAAIAAPMAVVQAACGMTGLLADLAESCNRRLLSDLAIAAALADAAARSGAWNVRVNLPLLGSPPERRRTEDRLEQALQSTSAAAHRAEMTARRRAPL